MYESEFGGLMKYGCWVIVFIAICSNQGEAKPLIGESFSQPPLVHRNSQNYLNDGASAWLNSGFPITEAGYSMAVTSLSDLTTLLQLRYADHITNIEEKYRYQIFNNSTLHFFLIGSGAVLYQTETEKGGFELGGGISLSLLNITENQFDLTLSSRLLFSHINGSYKDPLYYQPISSQKNALDIEVSADVPLLRVDDWTVFAQSSLRQAFVGVNHYTPFTFSIMLLKKLI